MQEREHINRRQFISGVGAAALSYSIMKPEIVRGSQANSKIKLGLIGCGGRGTWIADLFIEHGGYELTAAADYFKDQVDAFGDQFSIPKKKRFSGLSAYKRLLDSKVDAIVIESPPYFHPEQAAAGVEAGCHVYLAKPIAVDVPGCQSVKASGKKASLNNLCFLVDFQTRANDFFIEALKRVHTGAIGDLVFGEATYHASFPFERQLEFLEKSNPTDEDRLRAWGIDVALSGDIITEQNIHTLDVMNWIMNHPPLYAVGTSGHKARKDKGSCSDHYALLYQYPDNVGITFSSRQFKGHGTQPDGIHNRMFGSKGVLETQYGGQVIIRGENFYRGGKTPDIYRQGAVNNIAEFHNNIMQKNYQNTTVEPSVQSNLVTVLGRKAASEGEQVFWYQLMKDNDKLQPALKGLKD